MLSEDTPEGECELAAGVTYAFIPEHRNYYKIGLMDLDLTYTVFRVRFNEML